MTAATRRDPIPGGGRRRGATRVQRYLVASIMGMAAVFLIVGNRVLRSGELVISGVVMSLGAGHTVLYRPDHDIFFETVASRTVGLQITASCTAIFLIVPFFVLAGLMMLIPRLDISRLLLGVVVSTVVVFSLNQLRLLIIAWATHRWGIDRGFDWAHILAGAVVTTLSMLIALFLFFRLSLSERRVRLAA